MNEVLAIAANAAERGQWWPDSWFGRTWILFGFGAQLLFTARFLVQWIASERLGKSYVPKSFWYLSIVGAAMLLTYAAVWKHDPVIALGQTAGGFVYVRNLMLLRREKEVERHPGVNFGPVPAGTDTTSVGTGNQLVHKRAHTSPPAQKRGGLNV